jgi:serine/threonine-protein kinase HipA
VETAGDRPTTHIDKPAIPRMVDQDLNEHLTMRLAAAVGLPVALTEVVESAAARALVVTRFDRYQSSDGSWRRVHTT